MARRAGTLADLLPRSALQVDAFWQPRGTGRQEHRHLATIVGVFAMAGMWHGELHGGPFTATVNFIEHYGRVRGAAFPSEHVAGSVAALWGAWRFRRWLFWVMVPLFVAMCVSTIWGRYHYVADVFGGIVTGTLGYLIGSWIMRRSGTAFSEQRSASSDQ